MNKREIHDLPPFGMVVARIINDAPGDRAAVNYGYPAQSKTWWMVVDSAGIPRSRFFIRTYKPGPPAIAYVTTSRPYTRCTHPDRRGRPARAKFWTCAESAAESSYSFRGDRVMPSRHEASLEAYVHAVGFGLPASPPTSVTSFRSARRLPGCSSRARRCLFRPAHRRPAARWTAA